MTDATTIANDASPSRRYNALIELGSDAVKEQRLKDAINTYREAMVILDEQFGLDGLFSLHLCQIIASLADQIGDHGASELAGRRLLDQIRRERSEENTDVALSMNQLAIALREQGKLEEAEEWTRKALEIERRLRKPNDPKIPHRLNNLATVLLLRGKLEDLPALHAEAWSLKQAKHDITSARILLGRLFWAMLTGHDTVVYIGQLKTLLGAASLGYASNVSVEWTAQSLMRLADERLSVEQAKLVHELFIAMNDPTARDHLDANEAWRNQPAAPLDQPWPDAHREGDECD